MAYDLPDYTSKQIPVLIDNDFGSPGHVMAKAEIFRRPDTVLIQITSSGEQSQVLADYLLQAAPIAISFISIPVQNITEKRENN